MGVSGSRQRNIFFYRAKGSLKGQNRALDGVAIEKKIVSLPWEHDGRYQRVDDEHKIAAWEIEGTTYSRMAFGYIRPDDDSRIDNRGQLRRALTEQGDGLTEFTYCVFFPDDIVGVIFDAVGPKLKRVAEYIIAKCPELYDHISFSRLVHEDFISQIDRLGAITNFEIAIHPSQSGLFDDIDDTISDALNKLKNLSEGESIQVNISAGRGKNKHFSSKFRETLKKFLNKPLDRATVTRLRLSGRDSAGFAVPPIDLLLQQFVFGVKVDRPDSDSDLAVDCFRKIEEQFITNGKQLHKASAIESDD